MKFNIFMVYIYIYIFPVPLILCSNNLISLYCVFQAEIGRHTESGREWEVYRFLLDENTNFTLFNARTKDYTVDIISRTLMGW